MNAPATLGLPLVEELHGITPWEVFRRLANEPHCVFFDSAVVSPQGQYSYVSADPLVWLESSDGDAFASVRELLAKTHFESVPGLPPFQGGVAGLFLARIGDVTEGAGIELR